MNQLTVFNQDIIPVYTTEDGKKVVIGRELHERLKIGTDYKDWLPRMCEYGFSQDLDYAEYEEEVAAQNRARTYRQKNHLMTLEMAKEIAMIQRTPEGHAIRQKLIDLETDVSELSPELRYLIKIELEQKQQAKALADMTRKLDDTCDLIALNPQSWRKECDQLINRVARERGGEESYKNVRTEIFQLVDARAGVSLETRLTNKRRRMAEEGACKSKRDKLNKVDVIAEDKKLIEIYIAVVKEMAVKYGAVS